MSASDEIRFGTDGWRAVIGDGLHLREPATGRGRDRRACSPPTIPEGGLVGHDTRFEAAAFAAAAARRAGGPRPERDRVGPLLPDAGAVLVRRARRARGRRRHAHREPQPRRVPRLQDPPRGRRRLAGRPSRTAWRHELRDGARPRQTEQWPRSTSWARTWPPSRPSWTASSSARRTCASRSTRSSAPAAGYLADTLRSLGVEVTEIHGEDNPGFGGLHPEPIPPHVDEVRELVRAGGLDAAFVTDGDADRIGASDARRRVREPASHHRTRRASPDRGPRHARPYR